VHKVLFAGVLLLIAGWVQAGEAAPVAEDPALERRVADLAQEIRCLVCQNQSLSDSNAPLAVDLRNQIREQLRAGASRQDVVNYLVARYGEFVLYRPPLNAATLLLWLGPLLLLAGGTAALLVRVRRRRIEPEARLSEGERARAAALLSTGDGDGRA